MIDSQQPKLYYAGNRVVGELRDGVFEQNIKSRHIYRAKNAKGMDLWVHRALRGYCELWRIIFKDTHQVLSIPYDKIELVGTAADPGGGIGVQIFVKLEDFDEENPATQMRLL